MTTEYKIKFYFSILLITLVLSGCFPSESPTILAHAVQFKEDYKIDASCIENALNSMPEVQSLEIDKRKCGINTPWHKWEFDCYKFNYKIVGSKYLKQISLRKMDTEKDKLATFILSRTFNSDTSSIRAAYENSIKDENLMCNIEKAVSSACNLNRLQKDDASVNNYTSAFKNNFCM